jgi:hypothetical protein
MGLAIKSSLTVPGGTPRSATGADASCIAVSTERPANLGLSQDLAS